ncbi:MAG: M28 family peptidase [Anaerolineales bacterium]
MSELSLNHIKHLAEEIGPRGSCTEAERKAHEYCRKVLGDLKYDVHWEVFRSPLSAWLPYALATGIVLGATLLSLIERIGPLVAAALTILALVSFFRLVMHRDNPLLWLLPVGESQNVWAKAASKGETKRTVVIDGHVDTHRTAWAMSGKGPFTFLQALTTAGTVAIIALLVVFVVRIFAPSDALRTVSLALGAVVLVAFVVVLLPEFTKYVPGGNDNATGAATVLDFAARLKKTPLQNTEVYFLLSGCEEVGACGTAAFVKTHPELADADYLVLDSIGGAESKPYYVLDETLLLPIKSDPGLVSVAREVAAQNGDARALPKNFRGAYTDMSPVSAAGQRGIAFVNYRPSDGMIPHWHQQSDTAANVDADVLAETQEYIWEVLQALDAAA